MGRFLKMGILMFVLLQGCPIRAVLFVSTADSTHNTQPPSGALAGSGWQWQGEWKSFLGTVVGPNSFLTSRHLGGTVGDVFVFRGVNYQTIGVYDDPVSDLRLWKVCGQFPDYAPLYDGPDETGAQVIVFGRGNQRGAPVFAPDNPEELRGWKPGAWDGRWRWGTNQVIAILKIHDAEWAVGFLAMDFDEHGGGDEAHLTGGDSGGGIFIRVGTEWKLAGISYAVDGNFNTSTNGNGFPAALFDARGFYVGTEEKWDLVTGSSTVIPSAFYGSRVSTKLHWLRGLIEASGPGLTPPVLQSGSSLAGPFLAEPEALLDSAKRQIRLPITPSTAPRFFRLSSDCPWKFMQTQHAEGFLIFSYE